MSAILVNETEGLTARRPQPPVAPTHERHDDREQVPAFFSETVFPASRSLLIGVPLEYPAPDQPLQPVGKDVARDPKASLELLEAAQTQERIPNDEQCPPIADLFQAGRN